MRPVVLIIKSILSTRQYLLKLYKSTELLNYKDLDKKIKFYLIGFYTIIRNKILAENDSMLVY